MSSKYDKFRFRMRYLSIILFSLVLLFSEANSQQNNNWYFGRKAGLSFNSMNGQQLPVVLSNSAMLADEAAAAISDENGNLLFYTNGATVFNKLHQVMLNGNNLDGYISATQIVIVPMPGNASLYYIFTTGAIETGFASGYRYSVVDMSRDNNKGEVIVKNNLLWASCTERITAARHSNGIDVWVITNDNNSNIFRSWLVTCTGIQPPVVSTVGILMNQHSSVNSGVLKVSPDGRFMVQSHFPFFEAINYIPNFIQLFNFNNNSGTITNPKAIGFPDAQFTHCEFSSDSRLLYLTRPSDKKVDQIDITLPTVAAIQATRTILPSTNPYFDIQLAPDGKIYLTSPSFELATIHNPNTRGFACNLQQQSISLLPGSAYLGLPSHINDIVSVDDPDNGYSYTITDTCSGIVQFNGYTTMSGIISWLWDFGDGTTSTSQNPVHTFTPANALYMVKLKITSTATCGTIYKLKNIKPQGIFTSTMNFSFKNVCDSGYIRFTNTSGSLNEAGVLFQWDFGDGNLSTVTHPTHTYTSSGNYTVTLRMSTGSPCLDNSVAKRVDYTSFSITASPDQTIRVGQNVLLSYSGLSGSSEWTPDQWLTNNHSKSPIATPLEDIQYKITVTDTDGCVAQDSVLIKVLQYDDIYVPTAFTPNNDGLNEIIKPFYPGTITLKMFSIFNRWGDKVFSTSQRGDGWDGKINGHIQSPGVFVWTMQATDEKTGKPITRKGTITLVR